MPDPRMIPGVFWSASGTRLKVVILGKAPHKSNPLPEQFSLERLSRRWGRFSALA
jgi:hypothetical protein